jgi:iron complex outermembrane receptor protein
MSVKGIEFNLNYDVIRTDNVNWNVGFNATRFERRIDALALGSPIFFGGAGGGTGATALIQQEGFTPGSFFVYKQLYNNDGSPIEGAFGDLNGDGIVTADDRYIYKNADPDVILGFSTSFNYKNFDLGFNLRANIGSRILNATRSARSYSSLIQNGVMENISPFVEVTNFEFQNEQTILSDMFIENGSFLRMDFATAGYTFPRWLDGKASLRLFTGVQNPFIITKYTGLDPEINGGIDNTIYPRQRQILFGANIKF